MSEQRSEKRHSWKKQMQQLLRVMKHAANIRGRRIPVGRNGKQGGCENPRITPVPKLRFEVRRVPVDQFAVVLQAAERRSSKPATSKCGKAREIPHKEELRKERRIRNEQANERGNSCDTARQYQCNDDKKTKRTIENKQNSIIGLMPSRKCSNSEIGSPRPFSPSPPTAPGGR